MKLFARTPLGGARWVVIDCETSGLDPRRDRLLSVAAVEVRSERIELSQAVTAVLAQAEPSRPENILVHGIGADAQRGGRPPGEVLAELAAFMGDASPAAFHAPFDHAVLRRAFAAHDLRFPRREWLDLACLAPALFPGAGRARWTLDDWLACFSIECPARHDALGDAYATAQLLLVLLAEAGRQGTRTAEALLGIAAARKWLPA